MKDNNLIKNMLVVGIIFILTSTCLVQGNINDSTQTIENHSMTYENFIPYLVVEIPGETKTFTPTDDTYIANYDPSEINGDLIVLATRNRYGAGSNIWECDILIKFDVSSIAPSTPVLSASLNLYYYDYGNSNPAGRPLTVYQVTSDWDEMSVNFNTQPSKATTVSQSENVPGSIGEWMSWDLTD
ncbi:MAG TPA: DNRLRE domain-containing protein, partial [Thermoplasmata archaeon]|nr:DNRLRE domain-containing protein [Thermoplasmata archaeon]